MKKGKKLILLLVFTIVLIQFFSSSGLMINGTESITNEVSKKSLVINTIAPETIKANKDASHEQSTAAFTTIGNGFQTNDNTGNNTTSSNKKIDKKQVIVKYRDVSKAEETKSKFASKKPSRKLISKKSFKNFKLETLEISEFEDVENIIKELQGDSNIEYAQPDYLLDINLFPQDERFAEQWALLNNGQTINGQVGISQIDINAVNAWDITKGSKNVTVAVVDTDIDIDHTDLDGNIFVNIKEQLNGLDDDGNGYIDDINGWDVVNNDSSVFDTEAYEMHGTHVSGIIAAKHNNGGIAGVSPDVNILPIKFINGSVGYSSDAIAAIEYAVSMGASIINCSWGGSEYNQALKDVMENSNALFVCAAGNSARNTDVNPIYPACFDLPNIISVGAFDNKGEIAVFSNYGSKIHVAAPGVDILSTLPGNKYGLMSGTSMAAPYVSGVAALLNSKENVLSAQSLKARIMDNVTKVQNLIGKVSTSGRINMEAALLNSTPSEIAQPTAESIPTESPITTELVNMNVGIVKMEFDKTSAAVGDIITATLKVEGVNYFSGSQVNIKYDPAVVQPVDNNLQPYNENTRPAGGNILINNDYSPISYASNDLSRGILNFCNGYIDLLGYKEGTIAETFGTLAVIKFKVLSNNQIQIKFENTERMPGSVSGVYLYDWDGNKIVSGGFTVEQPQIINSNLPINTQSIESSSIETSFANVTGVSVMSTSVYKVSGYIASAITGIDMDGFNVEVGGNNYVTGKDGYFEILVPEGSPYTVTITKAGYLKREIDNVNVDSNIMLGKFNLPVVLWPGDFLDLDTQDGAINMTDIMEMSKHFNSVSGSSRYNAICDVDRNSVINIGDIMNVVLHFNKASSDYQAVQSRKIIMSESYSVSCTMNKIFDFAVKGDNLTTSSTYEVYLSYNPTELEVLDLCSITYRKDLSAGEVTEAHLNIANYSPGYGKAEFVKVITVPSGKSWTGVINSIKFKSKVNGNPQISYIIEKVI